MDILRLLGLKTKTLSIPKDNAQTVEELQSWTVEWGVLTGWLNDRKIYHKAFIKKSDAEEFRKQLREAAEFTRADISTKMYEN